MDTIKLKQAIISAIHGLPWEEARWVDTFGESKESIIHNCLTKRDRIKGIEGYYTEYSNDEHELIYSVRDSNLRKYSNGVLSYFEPKGQPITLSRVLQAMMSCLQVKVGSSNHEGFVTISYKRYGYESWSHVQWKLLKEDKSTATLEDQSEETIEALGNIFLTSSYDETNKS